MTETTAPAPSRFSLTAILPVALFGLLALGFLVSLFRSDPSALPSALIGKPVPQFALPAVAGIGKPGLATADFGGGTVSVVNVWASWCPPCREEQPLLVSMKAKLGAPLFGINQKDKPEDAARFLKKLGNPFERIGADANGRVSIDWGVYGVPETYVVDGKGRITYKFIGPLTEAAIERELLPAIAKAKQSAN